MDAARRVSAYRGGAAALQTGLRFEYGFHSQVLNNMAKNAVMGPEGHWYNALAARSLYFYQPERTRGLYAARFHNLTTEAAKPCLDSHPDAEPAPVDARPNVLGRVFFNMAMPRYEKILTKRCESDFHVAAVAVAAALAAYRLDHKRNPAALSELVPRYLASVPADPFTGKPLLYSPDGPGAVHSAGNDTDGKQL